MASFVVDSDIIRLCQGGEVVAVARLDGTIVECSSIGAERTFGLKPADLVSKNILDLVDSTLDQAEFHQLNRAATRPGTEATCLLRTKETKTFIWADRRSMNDDSSYMKDVSTTAILPRIVVRSPDLTRLPPSSRKKVVSDKTYQALDTEDMSFNDVFEDIDDLRVRSESSSASNMGTPSASEQSLPLSDAGAAKPLSPKSSVSNNSEDWGWFMTITPSSSATFSNITSQIRLV